METAHFTCRWIILRKNPLKKEPEKTKRIIYNKSIQLLGFYDKKLFDKKYSLRQARLKQTGIEQLSKSGAGWGGILTDQKIKVEKSGLKPQRKIA